MLTTLRRPPAILGLALIALGLTLRRVAETTLAPDRRIESPIYLAGIVAAQMLAIAAGAFLLVKRPAIRVPRKTELGLLALGTVAALLLLEIGARVWLDHLATSEQYDRYVLFTSIDPGDFAWTPHPYLSYASTPNYRKGRTAHNSLGYRGDEFPQAKPDGVYRIVALGGSSTYDVRIEDNQATFTAQLERLLREEYGHRNVEVINAGVPGYNSWEMLVNLEFRVLDLDPDLIIVCEGTNDVHARLVQPSAYRGDNSGRRQSWRVPRVPVWEHSALLRILGRWANVTRQVSVDDFVSSPTYLSWPYDYRLGESGADPVEILEKNPPVYFRRNLENMIAVANEHGARVLLATWAFSPHFPDYASRAYSQRGFRENNDVVREVAAGHRVSFFDLAEAMPQEARYWADGRHVNEAGALEKAALFAGFIHAQGLIGR